MVSLSLTLLGSVACTLEGRAVRFGRRSGLALAVYLACAGRSQSRATLETLIAGESDEASASMALRNALRDLRTVLGEQLQVDSHAITLAPTVLLASDVAEYEAKARIALEQKSVLLLREAVAAYGGEFAPGLLLKGAPAFDEWLLYERERLRASYLRVLEQLAVAEERAGDCGEAIATTRRLLAAGQGLALIKNRWVAVDTEKLRQTKGCQTKRKQDRERTCQRKAQAQAHAASRKYPKPRRVPMIPCPSLRRRRAMTASSALASRASSSP
ncbi:MAG: hypothetical protein EOM24_16595 [Chloroflexia bacterium]|nr:hypothetical protein [Chloroflexia bacterium]